jgi:glycosyltransferase involved in cell wall biosynthesis
MLGDILYITESSGYGGAESYLLGLAINAAKDVDVVAVAMSYSAGNENTRAQFSINGINVIDTKQVRANYLLNICRALKFLFPRRNSQLHFSLPYPDSCRWLLLVASLLKCKFIITEHLVPASPYQAGPYFFVTHLLFNQLKKLAYHRSIKVIAISKAMKATLIMAYGMPAEKLVVIYNGINSATIASDNRDRIRGSLGISSSSIVLMNVGRLSEQKGHFYLLSAVARLKESYPNLILLLVGDGPLRATVEDQISALGIAPYVKMLGFKDNVAELLKDTDVFILPSLNEGFPLTILEAMSAAKPVIATDVGGNSEAVIHGETGIIVPPKDVDSLCQAIRTLLDDPVKRTEMGQKGQQRSIALFSKKKMLKETFALYQRPV